MCKDGYDTCTDKHKYAPHGVHICTICRSPYRINRVCLDQRHACDNVGVGVICQWCQENKDADDFTRDVLRIRSVADFCKAHPEIRWD